MLVPAGISRRTTIFACKLHRISATGNSTRTCKVLYFVSKALRRLYFVVVQPFLVSRGVGHEPRSHASVRARGVRIFGGAYFTFRLRV